MFHGILSHGWRFGHVKLCIIQRHTLFEAAARNILQPLWIAQLHFRNEADIVDQNWSYKTTRNFKWRVTNNRFMHIINLTWTFPLRHHHTPTYWKLPWFFKIHNRYLPRMPCFIHLWWKSQSRAVGIPWVASCVAINSVFLCTQSGILPLINGRNSTWEELLLT